MKNIAVDLIENCRTFRIDMSDKIGNGMGDVPKDTWIISASIWNKIVRNIKQNINRNLIR